MRAERERQVETKQQAAKEEVARIEVERRAAAMKRPLEFRFRFFPISPPLEFSFILCKIDFPLEFSFRLTFQISDWLQIDFGFISDWYSENIVKLQISDWFRLVQIDPSDFRLASDCFQNHFRLLSEKNRKSFRFQIGSDWFRLASE